MQEAHTVLPNPSFNISAIGVCRSAGSSFFGGSQQNVLSTWIDIDVLWTWIDILILIILFHPFPILVFKSSNDTRCPLGGSFGHFWAWKRLKFSAPSLQRSAFYKRISCACPGCRATKKKQTKSRCNLMQPKSWNRRCLYILWDLQWFAFFFVWGFSNIFPSERWTFWIPEFSRASILQLYHS